jgi:hypothetical protein
MVGDPDIDSFGLNGLNHRCQQESDLFFQRKSFDPRYCFELFRRAFMLRSEDAWECVYHQYRKLVLGWVTRHPLSSTLDEEAEYFLNRAFEKMWTGITPQKFAQFSDLKALLHYLQLCVHSVIVDHARAREQAILIEDDSGSEPENLVFQENAEAVESVEHQVASHLDARALWDEVAIRLKTEQERVVVYGMFVLNLKSREVYEEFHGVFANIDEIYMIKENIIARLRRDRDLVRALMGSGEKTTNAGTGDTGLNKDKDREKSKTKAPGAGKIGSRLV